MCKELVFKATVTGKRQITIPLEICNFLNIKNGDQVLFKNVNGNVIFDIDKTKQVSIAEDDIEIVIKSNKLEEMKLNEISQQIKEIINQGTL
ncbi:MAG: AbrB/MazE/SpoVT family DNA-binding domain-containing protein [Cetobacterium sp.]